MEKLKSGIAVSAMHDGQREDDHTSECHPTTRRRYLRRLFVWADSNLLPHQRIHWLSAPAGAGKTAIIRSFCSVLQKHSAVPFASFFFWKPDIRRNTLRRFPATIAFQLAQKIPALQTSIKAAFERDMILLERSFEKQMNDLIIDPLLSAYEAGQLQSDRRIVIVVDGLDECLNDALDLLQLLPRFISALDSLPISLLLSSRTETSIANAFRGVELARIALLSTVEAEEEDVQEFLSAEFKRIYSSSPFLQTKYKRWPSPADFLALIKKSSGYFICPKTAIRYIDTHRAGLRPDDRLRIVLSAMTDVESETPWHEPIDQLYRGILKQHAPRLNFDRFKHRLGLACLPDMTLDMSFSPQNDQVIAVFQEPIEELCEALSDLSSLFFVDDRGVPNTLHASFPDFVFNRERSLEFYVNKEELHAHFISRYLRLALSSERFYHCLRDSDTLRIVISRHFRHAGPLELLGQSCIDELPFHTIPTSVNFLFQTFILVEVVSCLCEMVLCEGFPQGRPRYHAMRARFDNFLEERTKSAERGEIALVTLAFSPHFNFPDAFLSHSTECLQLHAASDRGLCLTYATDSCNCSGTVAAIPLRGVTLLNLCKWGRDVTTVQINPHFLKDCNVAQNALDALSFIFSAPPSKTPSIMATLEDEWVATLLPHCRLDKALHDLISAREVVSRDEVHRSGRQRNDAREMVSEYISRCVETGIASPPIVDAARNRGKLQPGELVTFAKEKPKPSESIQDQLLDVPTSLCIPRHYPRFVNSSIDFGVEDKASRPKLESWLEGSGLEDSSAFPVVVPKAAIVLTEGDLRESPVPSRDTQSAQRMKDIPPPSKDSPSNGRLHENPVVADRGRKKRWYTRVMRRIKETLFLSPSD